VATGQAGEVAAGWPGQPGHRPRSGPRPRDETAARRRIAG
jgi:hypothetical protein